ncbi:hypothetical protein MZK47_02590 [Microbacterium aerolatum]|uniref:hypothetical protein n=1 Tax=Microbacterium aerolatum TaxID=153731 RepID=UPI00200133BA|nr:hypothetical protein [Microbacterium aerolatum]MCK3768559.1 hypothetical protein [Microbacterium aerolatum]
MTENQTDETIDTRAELQGKLPEGSDGANFAPSETPGKLPEDSETPANFAAVESSNIDEDAETFPRDYVVKLRDENAKYRQRAADRDEIATKLHTALVAATGRLADPSDLPFDNGHLADPDALTAALDALLQAKPHLASRKPTGNIGQGVSGASDSFSLSALLKSNAS